MSNVRKGRAALRRRREVALERREQQLAEYVEEDPNQLDRSLKATVEINNLKRKLGIYD